MLNPKDLYIYATTEPIGASGTALIQYEIHRYRDIRNQGNKLAYVVICTQRIIIPNASEYKVGPNQGACTSYSNYPAAFRNHIAVAVNPAVSDATILLRELFPRTLNASISTTLDQQIGTSSTSSIEQTSGSSTSQSNTFGVAVSAGFFGEMPVGNVTLEYQHGWDSGSSSSHGSAAGSGQQYGLSSGDTMSIKDWSSYGYVDRESISPTWVWGQCYPWDVILYNQSPIGNQISLPPFVLSRLMTEVTIDDPAPGTKKTIALPPSQISLFGLDFTMKAGWLIEFPTGVTASEAISFRHTLEYHTATHTVSGSGTTAKLTASIAATPTKTYDSPWMDLSTYALDPIAHLKSGAAINFMSANLFTYPPSAAGGTFKILSAANNLQVVGAGFGLNMTSDFANGNTTMSIQFKILDTTEEYSLLLHHWIGTRSEAVALSIAVNANPPAVVYADSAEGQGGQGNVSEIALRDLHFSSVNFHDYLQVGLNTVVINMVPVSQSTSNSYTMSALAIV